MRVVWEKRAAAKVSNLRHRATKVPFGNFVKCIFPDKLPKIFCTNRLMHILLVGK